MTLQPAFDTPSMLVMVVAGTLAMALALSVARPERREGMGWWALALVAHALTYVLALARDGLPAYEALNVVASNTMLTLALALLAGAIAGFHARPAPWWRMGVPVVLVAVLTGVFATDYRARILATSGIWAFQLALVLWMLWRPQRPPPSRGAALITTALGFQATLVLVRGLWFLLHSAPSGGFLRAGAMDQLALVSSHAVLVLASLGFVLLTKDRTEAANRRLAYCDELTGIANRRQLQTAVERDVAHAARSVESYSVLMVDIDRFKRVNDHWGHLGGDAVIRHVAHLLSERLRGQDLVGRWGGEEFLLLLPRTNGDSARALAEQLRQQVAATPCAYQGESIAVTVSIGCCTGIPAAADQPMHWVDAADRALYAAKRAGRDRVEHAALQPAPAPAAAPRV